METTEFIHRTSQQILEKLDEVRALIERIEDQPIRQPRQPRSVYHEMLAAGVSHDETWRVCTEMIGLRNQAQSLTGRARAEIEVLASVADDVIGKTGRLV